MILRLKCKSPISGVSYWPIKVRTGRGAPYSDFPKIMTVNLCLPTYKDKADPLLPPKIYFVSCICKGAAMAAQLFYRGTERKVKNTINYEFAQLCIFKLWTGSHNFTTCSSFFAGSPKKQMAGSREPGGKQDQDTGDIFFHSTSLTRFRFCGFSVGHLLHPSCQ